jgi:hypothetical protein
LIKGLFASSGGEAGRILKELNETIPVMMRDITRLDESRRRRREEIARLEVSDRHNRLDDARRSLAAADRLYEESMAAMFAYISQKREALEDVLQGLDLRQREEFQREGDRLINQFMELRREVPAYHGETNWKSYVNAQLAKAGKTIELLARHREQCRERELRQSLQGIIAIAREIHAELVRDPWKIGSARMFVTWYLEALSSILERHNRLSSAGDLNHGEQVQAVVERVAGAFRAIQQKMRQRDLLHLDAEVTVLDEALKQEMGGARD